MRNSGITTSVRPAAHFNTDSARGNSVVSAEVSTAMPMSRAVSGRRDADVESRTLDTLIQRLRAEFLEMPDLRLKSEQVQRLCGVERVMCQVLLDRLVDEGFLRLTADGSYVRLTSSGHRRLTTAGLGENERAQTR